MAHERHRCTRCFESRSTTTACTSGQRESAHNCHITPRRSQTAHVHVPPDDDRQGTHPCHAAASFIRPPPPTPATRQTGHARGTRISVLSMQHCPRRTGDTDATHTHDPTGKPPMSDHGEHDRHLAGHNHAATSGGWSTQTTPRSNRTHTPPDGHRRQQSDIHLHTCTH